MNPHRVSGHRPDDQERESHGQRETARPEYLHRLGCVGYRDGEIEQRHAYDGEDRAELD